MNLQEPNFRHVFRVVVYTALKVLRHHGRPLLAADFEEVAHLVIEALDDIAAGDPLQIEVPFEVKAAADMLGAYREIDGRAK